MEVAEEFVHNSDDALSKKEVRSFFEDGFVIVPQLFKSAEVSTLKSLAKELRDEAQSIAKQHIAQNSIGVDKEFRCDYPGLDGPQSASILAIHNHQVPAIKLISWVGGVKPHLVELGRHPKITTPVAQLLGSIKADHLINQIHYKIPHDNVTFAWHQDIQNRRAFDPKWQDVNKRGSFVQVITAIDRQTATNGPLIIVPYSHKKDLCLDRLRSRKVAKEMIERLYDPKEYKPLLMEPGDTIFMHPLILHKSDTNTSEKNESRDIFINGYSYPGANQKPYLGVGSAKEIELPIAEEVLSETCQFVSSFCHSN